MVTRPVDLIVPAMDGEGPKNAVLGKFSFQCLPFCLDIAAILLYVISSGVLPSNEGGFYTNNGVVPKP